MVYQIDQSIKIENTSKTTYVALANSRIAVVSILAKEKRVLKLYFRKIDTEYIGFEILIRSYIQQNW